MMYLRPLIVFLFAGLLCYVSAKDGDTLKAVVVLFRHGDRSPLSSWPNDIYLGNSSLWPDGYGQLNNKGKQRHYLLGQWLRQRYDGFLPRRYNCSDIYVKSTDVDRTLMSAASNLAGLYPPQDDQVWNSHLLWQAIPIHTTPTEQDNILAHSIPCAKHQTLFENLLQSDEFVKLNNDWADLYKNVSEATGFSSVNISTIEHLYSTLSIYKEYNLAMPGFADNFWPEFQDIAKLSFQLPTYTPDLAKLRVGPFFDHLLNYFGNVTNNVTLPTKHVRGPRHRFTDVAESASPKFLMLSAHDTTVADRTNAMGVFPGACPEFASTVIWELRSNLDQVHYVNMYFKNSTSFSPLTLPGCSFDCELEQYGRLLQPITATVDEWTQECNEN